MSLSAIVRAAAILLACLALAGEARASLNGVDDRPFLDLLGRVEAGPAGYDTITFRTRLRPPRPLSRMSIAEVLEFQRRVRASGASSSAMGRYQFIYRTLSHVVRVNNIDTRLPFDRVTQDALARMEMERCGFYDPTVDDITLANCLAHVWAALPLVSGPNRGRSAYHGVAGNRALVSVPEVFQVLDARFQASGRARPVPAAAAPVQLIPLSGRPRAPARP